MAPMSLQAARESDHGGLQQNPENPAAEDHVEHRQLAVPTVQGKEGADREHRRVDVVAGGTVSFDVPADIAGIFEVELEGRVE